MISVIIPIYNADECLQRTFDCLCSQLETDFEVLLIDDGSVDNSAAICKSMVEKDERFRYFYQENSGVSKARNNGIRYSSGKYITFIDADDELPDNYLLTLKYALENNNCEISVCDVAVVESGKEINRFTFKECVINKIEALDFLIARKNINSGPCAKMFSRNLIIDELFPDLKAYEDILFVLNVMNKCDKVAVTNKTEYRYVQNTNGAMSGYMKSPSSDIIIATDYLAQFIIKHHSLNSECLYVTLSHLYQYIAPMLNGKCNYSQDFIKKSRVVFRKYLRNILANSAFPWKEKMLYMLYGYGWSLDNKKLHRLR